MALHIPLDRRDLLRVRLANHPDPLWELVLSVAALQRHSHARAMPWADAAQNRLNIAQDRSWWGTLRSLIPPRGGFPDFLTPVDSAGDLDAGCELVVSTPTSRIVDDLDAAFELRRPTEWARTLAADRSQMHTLVHHIRLYYRIVLEPMWPQVQERVMADRSWRARQLIEQGVEELLLNLPAPIHWDGQSLHTRYPTERTLSLDGRGLILIPSYFCQGSPVTFIDPHRTPVLVYQARETGSDIAAGAAARLSGVLGAPRAAVLAALTTSATTTGLAERAGMSLASASEHAAALREADLITTRRAGRSVAHSLTPVGRALLKGSHDTPIR